MSKMDERMEILQELDAELRFERLNELLTIRLRTTTREDSLRRLYARGALSLREDNRILEGV